MLKFHQYKLRIIQGSCSYFNFTRLKGDYLYKKKKDYAFPLWWTSIWCKPRLIKISKCILNIKTKELKNIFVVASFTFFFFCVLLRIIFSLELRSIRNNLNSNLWNYTKYIYCYSCCCIFKIKSFYSLSTT